MTPFLLAFFADVNGFSVPWWLYLFCGVQLGLRVLMRMDDVADRR